MEKTVVVVPYFKSGNLLLKVLDSVPNFVDYVIVVNDCSPIPIPEFHNKDYSFIIYILNNETNMGVGGATKTGILFALANLDFDICFKVDSDNQMDLSHMKSMIDVVKDSNFDFVKGNRFSDYKLSRNMPVVRRIGNLGLSFVSKLSTGYYDIFDPTNGFLCIKREALESIDLNSLENRFFFETSLIFNCYFNNIRIKDFPMKPIYGEETSNLNVFKSFFEFGIKHLKLFFKRIYIKYFFSDFSFGSIYFVLSIFAFCLFLYQSFSITFNYILLDKPAPMGTGILWFLYSFMLIQFTINFFQIDFNNSPNKKP